MDVCKSGSSACCLDCGGSLRKKLCDDLPGLHIYIWACERCQHEYGHEWEEWHHGVDSAQRC